MKGLSTLEEVNKKGKIIEFIPSTIRENVYICMHELGHQSNINEETYKQLTNGR